MTARKAIFIGGQEHGKVRLIRSFYWKIAAIPKPTQIPFPLDYSDVSQVCETITYKVRSVGLCGTRRRMDYMALEGLSDDEFLKLVDEYESQP